MISAWMSILCATSRTTKNITVAATRIAAVAHNRRKALESPPAPAAPSKLNEAARAAWPASPKPCEFIVPVAARST